MIRISKAAFQQGDTFEEALENIKEAIAGHLEILAKAGLDIPLASQISQFVDSDEHKGHLWAVDIGSVTTSMMCNQPLPLT